MDDLAAGLGDVRPGRGWALSPRTGLPFTWLLAVLAGKSSSAGPRGAAARWWTAATGRASSSTSTRCATPSTPTGAAALPTTGGTSGWSPRPYLHGEGGRPGAEQVAGAVEQIRELALAADEEAGQWFTSAADRADKVSRIDLARTSSPAGLAQALVSLARLTPSLAQFDLSDEEHLRWCEAFHGGWSE